MRRQCQMNTLLDNRPANIIIVIFWLSKVTLNKTPKFHLISWCANFVERQCLQSFQQMAWNSVETVLFHEMVASWIGQITVFYVVESLRKISQNTCFLWPVHSRIRKESKIWEYTQISGSEKTCILTYFTQRIHIKTNG